MNIMQKHYLGIDIGSTTLYGDKTFENVNFTLVDWTDDSRTGSTENI